MIDSYVCISDNLSASKQASKRSVNRPVSFVNPFRHNFLQNQETMTV